VRLRATVNVVADVTRSPARAPMISAAASGK